ncbi:MAG: lipocalin family protein [Flavobacteriales bacterium]
MKRSILSYFSILALVAVFFYSCERNTKAKLTDGTWKLIDFTPKGYTEEWKFTDTEVILYHTEPGDTAIVFKRGTYSIKNNTISTTGEGLASAGGEYYRGDFQIRSLSSTELVLFRHDLGMQYYEFEKKQ